MLNVIGNALDRLGFHNRVCCAATFGCAWAVAQSGPHERTVVEPGGERAALAPLPVAALRISDGTIEALHEVNIDQVGQVLALPRLELAMRFDNELLRRIDQALGESAEIIDAVAPSEPIVAERAFSGAVMNLEAMNIVACELIGEVSAMLARLESGATRLELVARRLDATPVRLVCRLSRPSRDVKHLWSLFKPRVESLNMGYGVECVTLTASTVQRMAHQQGVEFADDRLHAVAARASGELIDTLTQRLGAARALRMHVVATHQPERVIARTPAMAQHDARAASAALVEADRPSTLFETPELIEVMAVTPDGPPAWLRWRGVEHRLTSAVGPERIDAEWWHARNEAPCPHFWGRGRDYFKVQDEAGRWLWVFHAPDSGRWFVQGEWA
jgi:protein ImuB